MSQVAHHITIDDIELSMRVDPDGKDLSGNEGRRLLYYTLAWSLITVVLAGLAAAYTGESGSLTKDYLRILTSPSKLVTDYFSVGSLPAAFLNAGICGLFCNCCFTIFDAKPSATLLAGYFLVIAHCFYGLNLLNMLPPFAGIIVFCVVRKEKIGNMLHLAMFATSLGPFISDFLFRYTLGDKFVYGSPQVTVLGIIISIVFGLVAGFVIPALIPGTTRMHRGHNLYKAGLAIGFFGVLANAFFYKSLGVEVPDAIIGLNPDYIFNDRSYRLFIDLYFLIMFVGTFLLGFIKNGKSMRGYRQLLKCDGWKDDFPVKFGMPLTWINIGIYGFFILLYFNIVILVTKGDGFTGATTGVIIAAITFAAAGQTPKNVWPIMLGYVLVYEIIKAICQIASLPTLWTISTQAYINGLAFATGLCPFAGRYGWKVGTIAGALSAILCTSTAAMHGGFVLYNGGFTAGLAALLLLPVLEFYKVKTRADDD